jgi:hypothetical protein
MSKETEEMRKQFDAIKRVLDNLIGKSEKIMPLFSESLQLATNILETYKTALITGLETDDKKDK